MIAGRRFEPSLRPGVERIVRETGEAIVARLGPDSLELEIEYVTALSEFDAYAQTLGSRSTLFVGAFPARDNDGVNAVTVTIPDRDGVVRAHPHRGNVGHGPVTRQRLHGPITTASTRFLRSAAVIPLAYRNDSESRSLTKAGKLDSPWPTRTDAASTFDGSMTDLQ